MFKLVTYIIIKHLRKSNLGFRNSTFHIPLLFFADDGLILTNSVKEAKTLIKELHDISTKCGLEINKLKSHILIFNKKQELDQIENIEVVDSIKYLGVKICANKDCFLQQKEEMINKANRLANLLPAIIYKSTNRLLIGKTFWKNIALPRILFASTVVPLSRKQIDQLQKIENKAYRLIFNASKFTPISALRGEVGSSLMNSRIEKNKIVFIKHLICSNNELLKSASLHHIRQGQSPWAKETRRLFYENGLNTNMLKNIDKSEIKKNIYIKDSLLWEEDLMRKSSLKIYHEYKGELKEEKFYTNSHASNLLFKCRTNTLILNDRNRFQQGNTECPCCDHPYEDLEHFLLHCRKFSTYRSKISILQQPYPEDNHQIIASLLLFKNHSIKSQIETTNYLKKIHSIRKKIVENIP